VTLAEEQFRDWMPASGPVQPAVRAPMRDGVRLAMTWWLPPGDGPFPAILTQALNRRRITIDHPGIRTSTATTRPTRCPRSGEPSTGSSPSRG
jgi:predicted acyl esterase